MKTKRKSKKKPTRTQHPLTIDSEIIAPPPAARLPPLLEVLPKRMTTKQAAEFLGLREQTLTIWRSTGTVALAYYKIGGRVRYDLADLEAFLQQNRRTQTA